MLALDDVVQRQAEYVFVEDARFLGVVRAPGVVVQLADGCGRGQAGRDRGVRASGAGGRGSGGGGWNAWLCP